MLENYIDVIEASRILDVHPETVKRLIREGQAPCHQVWEQVDHGARAAPDVCQHLRRKPWKGEETLVISLRTVEREID